MTSSHSSTRDLAVLIGRFQPFHEGHLSLLKQALDAATRVVVVIGSAFQARSPKHPFTWGERAEMIRRALPASEQERVMIVPVRDYFNEARWLAAVRRAVAEALAAHSVENRLRPCWSDTSGTPRANTSANFQNGRFSLEKA